VLEEARDLGFLGPGPVAAHVAHAGGFGDVVDGLAAGGATFSRAADLGSGGGVPGLVLALRFPEIHWTLVEAGGRRATFLGDAVRRLQLSARVNVEHDRAEVVGRSPAFPGSFDVVVARGFGGPAVVAECGAPLLVVGGFLVVSEPPGGMPTRWPASGLAVLGLVPYQAISGPSGAFQVLRQEAPCPDRFPRRVGVPAKRPLF
jgi:16S rRNA (guanine527-N7)-methyltransferase